jgi:hypothetical protein
MSTEDKLINVVVKYSQEGAQDVVQSDILMGKAADDFYTKQHQQWDTLGADFENFQKTVSTNSQTVTTGLKQVVQESDNTTKSFHALRMEGMELRQVGTLLTLGGGLMTAGIIADANNYVKTIGNINAGNAQWLGYENNIKNANLEIGESARNAMLPVMKEGADLMERMADLVKANPWIMTAALAVGGAMTVLGTATIVISELIRAVADIGLLLTKMGVLGGASQTINAGGGVGSLEYAPGGAAGTLGGTLGMVTLTATSVIIGVELGQALGNWLGSQLDKAGLSAFKDYKPQNLQDALMTLIKIEELPFINLARGLAQMDPALTDSANAVITWINNLNKGSGELVGASRSPSPTTPDTQTQQNEVQDFISFQKQMADATSNYESQRADTVKQYEQQMADATQQYESQRADIVSNFAEQQARSERDFGEQQATAARNFGEQQTKAVRDYNEQVTKSNRDFAESQANAQRAHNLEMAQLAQDHDAKMKDLAANRDALGLVKEQASYNLQVQQKDQTFNDQQQQNIQQHRQQLADQRQSFLQQQSDAQAAYDQQRSDAQAAHAQQMADQAANEAEQLAKLDANHKLEMAKLDAQEKDKLAKLDDAYKKQVDQIQTAFIDQLNALDANILGDSAAYTKYLENEATQFQTWLNNFKSQSQSAVKGAATAVAGTAHQAGGWANFMGPGEDGLPEYVMDNPTSMMMKSLLGNQMSQAGMISAVMAGKNAQAGGGGGRNLSITIVGKGLTMTEIQAMTDKTLDMRLGDLLPAFGGN